MDTPATLVWLALGPPPVAGPPEGGAAPLAVHHAGGKVPDPMIVLLHPRATKPKNRRFPLSILSIAAMLEGREDYMIVDGNVDPHPARTLDAIARNHHIELLAVSVLPGPQMVSAIPLCREFRRRCPSVPIVWGGYFPSLYPDAVLNAPYVDFAIRGQ